jgi:hypothetical protein
MVELSVAEGKLVLHVRGIDQLWALKSSLEIPLQHITGVHADPTIARGWWHGLKLMGSDIPGVLHAGTFYQQGKMIFWDVHNPENTIVIELRDERYRQLVVEVADTNAAVQLIQPYCQGS